MQQQGFEDRLVRLEHENRTLRRGLFGAALVAAAALFLGFSMQGKKPEDATFRLVRAEGITLESQDSVCVITADAIKVSSKQGRKTVVLGVTGDGAEVKVSAGQAPGPMGGTLPAATVVLRSIPEGRGQFGVLGTAGMVQVLSQPKDKEFTFGAPLSIWMQPRDPKRPGSVTHGALLAGSDNGCVLTIKNPKGDVVYRAPEK